MLWGVMKILLYNSAARGTGQFIRSLKIADFLTSCLPDCTCRVLAGNSIVEKSLARNTDIVALPQIVKSLDGAYQLTTSRQDALASDSASISNAFLIRRQIIDSTINSYDPDLFLVDSRPRGLADELVEPLSRISSSRCKSVLLLRDIVDAANQTVRRWKDEGVYCAIRTLYDSVAILGERSVFDAVREYKLQAYEDRVVYLGFLGNPRVDSAPSMVPALASKKRVLVTVGGGFDGSDIIGIVCRLLVHEAKTMDSLSFTIILGAYSPLTSAAIEEYVHGAAADVEVLQYLSDPTPRIRQADLVISMCGYNTLFELIEAQKKIIAVPRGHSGYEQSLRANLLSHIYDGIWVIPPNEFTPQRLATIIVEALAAPQPQVRLPMKGAANLMTHLLSLLGH